MKIFKKILAVLAVSVMTLSAASIGVYANNSDKVVDDADILSDTEEIALEAKISEVIEKFDYSYDIVIHTTNSTGNKYIEAYADDYYDYNDYGYDSQRSGIIFVVDMGERYWHMGTTGKGISAFTDYGLEKIDDKIIGYLSDGDYYRCFYKFVELADDYINQYETTGEAYDVRRSPGSSGSSSTVREGTGEVLFMSVFIGLIVALIVCLVMKSQLKSAKMQTNAQQYIRAGSFHVTNSREYFLYRNVTKTKIDRDSGSRGGGSHRSGGSTTHRSSSGTTHGGRSGRF